MKTREGVKEIFCRSFKKKNYDKKAEHLSSVKDNQFSYIDEILSVLKLF